MDASMCLVCVARSCSSTRMKSSMLTKQDKQTICALAGHIHNQWCDSPVAMFVMCNVTAAINVIAS